MMQHVVILGGGISGLALAHFLSPYARITLIEKSDRLGGWIRSVQQDSCLFECGPRGFRPTGKGLRTLELVTSLGLKPLASSHQARTRYLALQGKLQAVSFGFMLRHSLGCLRDLIQKPELREDTSLEAFFVRHFGKHFTKTFVGPLTRGIFGGNMASLSAQACAPRLWELEQAYGSFMLGWLRSHKPKTKPEAALCSFHDGMETLTRRLSDTTMDVRLNATVTGLSPYCVHLGEEVLYADALVSTLPAHALLPLLKYHDPLQYATISTVNFGWHRPLLQKRGYGFLVPPTSEEPIMGMTWDSEIFPKQPGITRLCTMIDKQASHTQLIAWAREAVARFCALEIPPDTIHVHTAHRAIPQYHVGHTQWVSHFKSLLPQGLYILGNSFYGVSINDCIESAERLANHLRSSLTRGARVEKKGCCCP